LEHESIIQPETKIDYSQTKVQPVSHEVLRDNKLFALFSKYKVNDQIKTLRTQILKKLDKIGGTTMMITSANPGEGKTFTSINLGISIAQEINRTVLIVDADLKNPAKNHYDFATDFFSINAETGLADVLLGNIKLNEALINPGIEKLTILPGGYYLHNSAELLGSPQMELLVKELKTRYKDRIIIFDTPAILTCADPIQLSKFVESVLFVVEEEKTSAEDIRQVMKLLSDINIIGMILNKSKLK
jgi:protein-tyrosine kinase